MELTELVDQLDRKIAEMRREQLETEKALLRMQGAVIALQQQRAEMLDQLAEESDGENAEE